MKSLQAAYDAQVATIPRAYNTHKAVKWAIVAALPLALLWIMALHMIAWHDKHCTRGIHFRPPASMPRLFRNRLFGFIRSREDACRARLDRIR
jgi:hypothetical protein